jgi:hypothetical protein
MESGAVWGSRTAQDGVRGGEDISSERTMQQHAMGESDGEIFFDGNLHSIKQDIF